MKVRGQNSVYRILQQKLEELSEAADEAQNSQQR